MSKADTIFIAFPFGGIVPAEIAGGQDRKVLPHEPVRVPRAYGEQLIEDRFAIEAEAPKKAVKPKGEQKPDHPQKSQQQGSEQSSEQEASDVDGPDDEADISELDLTPGSAG